MGGGGVPRRNTVIYWGCIYNWGVRGGHHLLALLPPPEGDPRAPSPPPPGKAKPWAGGECGGAGGAPPPTPCQLHRLAWTELGKGSVRSPPPASPSTSVVAVGVYGAGGRWDPIII